MEVGGDFFCISPEKRAGATELQLQGCPLWLDPQRNFLLQNRIFLEAISQSLEILKQRACHKDFCRSYSSQRLRERLNQRISEVFFKSMNMWPFFHWLPCVLVDHYKPGRPSQEFSNPLSFSTCPESVQHKIPLRSWPIEKCHGILEMTVSAEFIPSYIISRMKKPRLRGSYHLHALSPLVASARQ